MSHAAEPWNDWTPGVLSKHQMEQLVEQGFVEAVKPDIGVSSLDLTLSAEAYHLPEGAIKPSGSRYFKDLHSFGKKMEIGSDGSVLDPRQTYLVKLRERLHHLKGSGIYGQATAKSSIGRVDVLARLIVDGMDCYESFSPDRIESGDLYLEITPLTFPVRVKPAISLSQMRFFYGRPVGCQLTGEEGYRTFLKESANLDGTLSVDLSPVTVSGHEIVAFRAREAGATECDPVPLYEEKSGSTRIPGPSPWKYWEFVRANDQKRLKLTKGSFYILKSKELLALPKGVAVYCRAIDEYLGEMRIHYAGFAHPWFGRTRKDGRTGTPLIFEVRGHDVNVSLQDGETMARLLFFRMSEDASREDVEDDTPYNAQQLQLSKYFADWPEKVTVDEVCGTVTPSE